MLNLPGHRGCNCEGPTRRELLRIGSIGTENVLKLAQAPALATA